MHIVHHANIRTGEHASMHGCKHVNIQTSTHTDKHAMLQTCKPANMHGAGGGRTATHSYGPVCKHPCGLDKPFFDGLLHRIEIKSFFLAISDCTK